MSIGYPRAGLIARNHGNQVAIFTGFFTENGLFAFRRDVGGSVILDKGRFPEQTIPRLKDTRVVTTSNTNKKLKPDFPHIGKA